MFFLQFPTSLVAAEFPSLRWEDTPIPSVGAKGSVCLHNGIVLATRDVKHRERRDILCFRSDDQGKTWKQLGLIVRDDGDTDLGDGHLCELANHEICYSYRRNKYRGRYADHPTTQIAVAISPDGGVSWRPHSMVAAADITKLSQKTRPDRTPLGFWASFLFQSQDGQLHCIYDDEITPWEQDYAGHQWLTMKTWDEQARGWVHPVTVSRTDSPAKLARDGMPSVLEMEGGLLLCFFESCDLNEPYLNVIRCVESHDGGKSWNWEAGRRIIFQAAEGRLAIAPWSVALSPKQIICVFATNEAWPEFERPGQPPREYHLDIQAILSSDLGQTWSHPRLLYRGNRRNYKPGVVFISGSKKLLCQWRDYGKGDLALGAEVDWFLTRNTRK